MSIEASFRSGVVKDALRDRASLTASHVEDRWGSLGGAQGLRQRCPREIAVKFREYRMFEPVGFAHVTGAQGFDHHTLADSGAQRYWDNQLHVVALPAFLEIGCVHRSS